MAYLVTGGTGFIGRRLVLKLIARGEPIHVLVRAGSERRLERLQEEAGEGRHLIVPLAGDLGTEGLGIPAAELARLEGRIRHFFHLGALYDLTASAAALERANTAGTRHALEVAQRLAAGCFHFTSSIAAAGRFRGAFREEMFDEAQGLDHPYFRTKHEAEALVRAACRLPWRIYRPGMVVGDSGSGVMDKIDGPYYFFKLIQRVRDALPSWVPLVGFEGGHVNLVPVDFVAAALDHLAHLPGEDGRCLHLTDPQDLRVGAVLNLFAAAAHAPRMTLRLSRAQLGGLASLAAAQALALEPLRHVLADLLDELGIPAPVLSLLDQPTVFPPGRATALLERAGIRVPPLAEYAWRLWDYWERRLDPESRPLGRLPEAVRGKTVLITGGSSGIGRAAALELAGAGARVLIAARDPARLAAAAAELRATGAESAAYACDITDAAACDGLVRRVLAEHAHVDILINNAGRSIRRAIEHTYGRFHDYERLMSVNYFAAVRLTLALLPSMAARGAGHVISVSSIGALSHAARFAGYNASKAALEAFTRCAAAEYHDRGVRFTVINMPLVRTAMVAPTHAYNGFALLTPEQAAQMICQAVVRRPERLATPAGTLAQLLEALAPAVNRAVMSQSFRMFPESEAAGGAPGSDGAPPPEATAFAALLRGLHW